METLQDEKDGLIRLITWYRDEYHKEDFGHNDMIARVKAATESSELEPIHQALDDWLYY